VTKGNLYNYYAMLNIVYIEKLGDAMTPMGLREDPPLYMNKLSLPLYSRRCGLHVGDMIHCDYSYTPSPRRWCGYKSYIDVNVR